MVNAAANLSPERLSTKALAAAGQFRAIALWLNEPLIPQGIYAQVCQDKRPGCIRVIVEFERTPNQKPLIQYICHLMWQLNSPLIEGIHLLARPLGTPQPLWDQRIRIMTPALRERLKREQGQGTPAAAIPPAIATLGQTAPLIPGFALDRLLTEQLKTLRGLMLTGSAVAAFVFGCMVEVVMSARQEPSLPFQKNEQIRSQTSTPAPRDLTKEPQLPAFQPAPQTITADRKATVPAEGDPATSATAEATPISYKIEPDRDRPHVVNAALEPVGVLKHERLTNPQDATITLLFGGDVDLDGLPYSEFDHDGQLLAGLPDYQIADLAMVNLQDSLTTAATSLEEEFLERPRPEAINLLKEGGVDVVNLTGEASMAFGEQGLADTLDNLDRHGIFRVGAGRNIREARRPEIMDVKGQRIAYLSYDRSFNSGAQESAGGVNAVTMQDIIKDIQAIRDEVDWLVVNYRWTEQPAEKPAESQTNLARLAIDQGADLVIGQHPSQLQGAEIYKGRPIAYSLGDFVYGQGAEAPTPETAVLQVALRDGQMKVDLIPVKVQNGQPQKASGAEAKRILETIQLASQEFPSPMPASVILDAHSGSLTDLSEPTETDSFTGEQETWTAPAPLNEVEVEGVETTEPEEAASPAPTVAPAADQPLAAPADNEDELQIEMEPIPEGLLDEWGPKDSSNTIYEPESVLPSDLQFNKPDADKPAPQPKDEPGEKLEETAPAPQKALPTETELEVTHPPETIAPYSEPLVGPLSSVLEKTPDMKLHPGEVALTPQLESGMPESRVFKPLNALKADEEKPVTIEVKGQTTTESSDAE